MGSSVWCTQWCTSIINISQGRNAQYDVSLKFFHDTLIHNKFGYVYIFGLSY